MNIATGLLGPAVLAFLASVFCVSLAAQPGSLDTTFDPGAGTNDFVFSSVVQPDGKVVIGGAFTSVNGVNRNHIARLNADGSVDTTFDPGSDANVLAIALQPDGKVLIGGGFSWVGGALRPGIARLNMNGSLDATFNASAGGGTTVHSLALQPDGRILIGGDFSAINSVGRNDVARLNANGTLDTTFDPGTGVDSGAILALELQQDGRVLIGGLFLTFNGVGRKNYARLNADGSLDTTFNPGSGADATVWSLLQQPDGKILIGGTFTTLNGTPRNSVARLNANGSLDTTFSSGTGPNIGVHAMALQPDSKVVVGGSFTAVDGVNRSRIARLNANGSVDMGFDPGTGADAYYVFSVVLQQDGKVLIGGDFAHVNGAARSGIARLHGGNPVAPSVSGVTPDPVTPGGTLTITGTDLGSASSVTVGGIAAAIQSNSAAAIEVVVNAAQPLGVGQVVAVTTPGGTDNSATVEVIASPIPPPVVSGVSLPW
jgi:uncharacterized delta-60 repeat protein